MKSRPHRGCGGRGHWGRRHHAARFSLATVVGPSAHGLNAHGAMAGVRPHTLEEWHALGEPGQLLAGAVAGYVPTEVAERRGWSPDDLERHIATVTRYLAARRG